MKGYIQGIESENLSKLEESKKTHLWYAPVTDFIIENGLCQFSFMWDYFLYSVHARSTNDFNYVGLITLHDKNSVAIKFDHYKNKERNLIIGNYMESGIDYRIIVEAS